MPCVMPPCTWPSTMHGIDDRADVVDRDVADEARVAGLGVDLDDRRVRAARPREVRRVVDRRRLEARAPSRPAGRAPPTRPSATAASVVSLSGEPFTVNVPSANSRSSAATSRWCATIWRAFSITFSPAYQSATPPTGQAAAPVRVEADRRDRRVAVQHLDRRRCRSRAGRRRSGPRPSRGPARAARCR